MVDLSAFATNSDVPDLTWQLLGINYTVKSLPYEIGDPAWQKYSFSFIFVSQFFINIAFQYIGYLDALGQSNLIRKIFYTKLLENLFKTGHVAKDALVLKYPRFSAPPTFKPLWI